MADEDTGDVELMLSRFNRLIEDLMRGATKRNTFQRWEIDLLLDIDSCELDPRKQTPVLKQYQRVAEKQLDYGILPPLKLSEYLAKRNHG